MTDAGDSYDVSFDTSFLEIHISQTRRRPRLEAVSSARKELQYVNFAAQVSAHTLSCYTQTARVKALTLTPFPLADLAVFCSTQHTHTAHSVQLTRPAHVHNVQAWQPACVCCIQKRMPGWSPDTKHSASARSGCTLFECRPKHRLS